jgi:hypothetical protein
MQKPKAAGLGMLLIVALRLGANTAYAQDGGGLLDRFAIHGYLTQAYGRSDRAPIYGLTKDGTWDYRVLALQLRYAATDDDHFVVQLRNRRVGTNIVSDEGVVLEWAYYQHNFGVLQVKVGRAPLPLGLYNEIRNVGTVIPFLRAPPILYIEGSEAFDGVLVSNRTRFGRWALESTAYGGGVRPRTQLVLPTGTFLFTSEVKNTYGGQLWLETPVQGLRVGASAFRGEHFPLGPDTSDIKMFQGSVDGSFDRLLLRAEYQRLLIPRAGVAGVDLNNYSYYVQGSIKVIGPWWIGAQIEQSHDNVGGDKYTFANDRAAGLNYKFSPERILKLEGHTMKGYNFDQFNPRPLPPGRAHYGLISLSVSF